MEKIYRYFSNLSFWYVMISVILWTFLYYFVVSKNSRHSELWNCRIIAMIHSLTITKLVEISFIFEGNPFYNIGGKNTSLQSFVMVMSGGYFFFDFVWCLLKGNEGFLMLLHHIISILSLIGGFYLNHSGPEICMTLWGSELTNPFLQIRWFVREQQLYKSGFGVSNDMAFFFIFALARIGIGSGLAYFCYHSNKAIFVVKVGGFLFYGISIIWMWQICKVFKQKYLTKGR